MTFSQAINTLQNLIDECKSAIESKEKANNELLDQVERNKRVIAIHRTEIQENERAIDVLKVVGETPMNRVVGE